MFVCEMDAQNRGRSLLKQVCCASVLFACLLCLGGCSGWRQKLANLGGQESASGAMAVISDTHPEAAGQSQGMTAEVVVQETLSPVLAGPHAPQADTAQVEPAPAPASTPLPTASLASHHPHSHPPQHGYLAQGPVLQGQEIMGQPSKTAVERMIELRQELDQVQKQRDQAQAELQLARQELQARDEAIAQATQELQQATSDYTELQSEFQTWRGELQRLQQQVREDRRNQVDALVELQTRLDSMLTRYARTLSAEKEPLAAPAKEAAPQGTDDADGS